VRVELLQVAEADLVVVGEMNCEKLASKLKELDIQSPEPNGGKLSDPFPFNLMFRTSIGPRGDMVGFLRPETAQGIFVSFRDLLYFNGGRLPMAVAQIGQSFRNEIAPKQGLLRVREFTQAEIEHFVHPERKQHPRFSEVADVAPMLASVSVQQKGERPAPMKLGDAVKAGIIANETLAYYIGRTYLFMLTVGVNPKRMKFRQHLPNEMAHYACGATYYMTFYVKT
jgi:glycyl-tRNA synthetase